MRSGRGKPYFKRHSSWLPALVVLAVVLLAGARLTELSMRQHAAQAREAAKALVAKHQRVMEAQLRTLAERAERPKSMSEHNMLLIGADGTLLQLNDSDIADPATGQGIVSEWAALDARRGFASRGILGPVRLGSQWIVAARAPVVLDSNSDQQTGWAVAYQTLDRLLVDAKLSEIAQAGYDFEVAQLENRSKPPRVFVGSRPVPLDKPVAAAIRWPQSMQKGSAVAGLTLAIRPKAGWYPLGRLSASIGLLLAIAWLLALLTYDVIRHSRGLRAALAKERRRLRAANQRVLNEVELRLGMQKSLDHARHHDAFTGLPNRLYFMDQLDRALREARTQPGFRIAVLLVEIDRFKLITDTLGQTAGDELMLQVARRFQNTAGRLERALARWSGDQFAVLLGGVQSDSEAIEVARLLQDALRETFELRRLRLTVGARMGITYIQSGLQRAEEVLREADVALSVAKTPDSPDMIVYEPSMGGNVISLVRLEADLQLALERKELKLLFQPIVDLRTRRIAGAEALLRWKHPTEGLLGPDRFLAVAEETGPMVPITRWIVASACRTVEEWRRILPQRPDLYVSVNLSAGVLRDAGFDQYVAGVLQETRTPASALRFELTEGGLVTETGAAREILQRLHALGIRLTLDDFGTGHSSLNYLQLFPFDDLKIDRPFIDGDDEEGPNRGIIRAILQMAWSLGLTPIAEKVETPAALQALTQMGCQLGQGYLLGEPVDAGGMLDRLMEQELASAATVMVEPLPASADWPEDDSPTLILPASSIKVRGAK